MDEDRSVREFVRRGYDQLGDTYTDERSPTERELSLIDAFLDERSADDRLLDAGCGQGTAVLERVEGLDAVGLDLSRGQLGGARRVASAARLVQGDLATLPFTADSFDAATAFHSLIHVPEADHAAAVAELARVLRPGGEVLLTEGLGPWSGTHDDWLGDGTAMTWDVVGVEETLEQLADAGFEVLDRWEIRDELADEEASWAVVRARLSTDRR